MFLERRTREVLDSIIGPGTRVLNRTRYLLDVLVDLLLVGRSRNRGRSDQVD